MGEQTKPHVRAGPLKADDVSQGRKIKHPVSPSDLKRSKTTL